MKTKLMLVLAALMISVSAFAQTVGGYPARKVAEFHDGRNCAYYLVQTDDVDSGNFILKKVSLKTKKSSTVKNPYDIDGENIVKDAKLVGNNLYVINTSYRQGDNLACLDTRTGKWTNPVPSCADCEFRGNNQLRVTYSKLFKEGKYTSDRRYSFSEKTLTLK